MDRQKIESFLDLFVDHAAGAMAVALMAVAERSGLIAWLAEHGSGTPPVIADGSGLNERYVREILSGLAAAKVVEYDSGSEEFSLPPEHAVFLASEMSPYFMGGWLDMIPSVMGHIDDVTDATKNGGGVAFEAFGDDMIRGLDRGNAPSQRVFLIRKWLPAIDGLIQRLEEGIRVADVGCGAGTVCLLIARAFPKSEVVGFDVSEASLNLARSRAEGVPNVRFEQSAAEELPTDEPLDLITTFDVIHDLVDPLAALKRVRQGLSGSGVYLMMEPNSSSDLAYNLDPRGALLYGVSAMHCMTQSLALGGAGLGAAWGRELAEEYCIEAGFSSFEPLEDITNRFSAFYEVRP